MADDSFADMWTEFKAADKAEPGAINDTGNDVLLGPKLSEAIHEVADGYLKKLEFPEYGETEAADKRARLLDLHWGRIEHDASLLEGLGAALDTLSRALESGVTELGESWKGESFDAFKVAIDKIRTTLESYALGATATGIGLRTAMKQARDLYENYAQESVRSYLNFDEETVSPPDQWHKMTENDEYGGPKLAECSPAQRDALTGNFVTERYWEIYEKDADRFLDRMVEECEDSRQNIKGQLEIFFDETNRLVNSITEMMDLAVGNLDELASAAAFTSLRVIASGSVGVAKPPPVPEPTPEPIEPQIKAGDHTISVTSPDGEGRVMVTVAGGTGTPKKYELDFGAASGMSPETEPSPAGVEQVPARTDGKCVIEDGDLTITAERPLFAPESVTITVDNGSGSPTTHTLDFAEEAGTQPWEPAAPAGLHSGQPGTDLPASALSAPPSAAATAPETAATIPDPSTAIPDATTATAEATTAFPDPSTAIAEATTAFPDPSTAIADPTTAIPDATTATAEATTAFPDPTTATADATTAFPDPAAAIADATTAFPDPAAAIPDPTTAFPDPAAVIPDPTTAIADPATAIPDPATATADPAAAISDPAVAISDPATAIPDPATATPDPAAAIPDPATAIPDPSTATADSTTATPDPTTATPDPTTATPDPAPQTTAPSHVPDSQITTTQAWLEESGSLSGVLVPEQADGEAELASAPDAPEPAATGMVGAGLPMMGTPGSGSEPGRAGSGWSVHGDLFDSAEPVYSMHGVLGDDDQDAER